MSKKKYLLTEERDFFRPFSYPWAYDAWLTHEQSHWLHTEVPMLEDVKDYKNRLSKQEQEFLTKILRFFVQGDLDIGEGYTKHFLPVFKQPEVRMMMNGFVGREALHVAAYAHLIETLGLPESTYNEFLQYGEMVEKHEYVKDLSGFTVPEKIAIISSFGEGMQLFSSFIMLLNFARHGKLRGLGQIISWSIVDETQHAEGMIKVFREFVKQNPSSTDVEHIQAIAKNMVDLEDKFIDLAFNMVKVEGLTAEEVKLYIRYIADRRLIQMGYKGVFKVKKNPLPWVEAMINAPGHTNFFENRSSDYAKGSLSGSWDDVWAK
jgi:ribonucleoside-diphosphate reductase beta chain